MIQPFSSFSSWLQPNGWYVNMAPVRAEDAPGCGYLWFPWMGSVNLWIYSHTHIMIALTLKLSQISFIRQNSIIKGRFNFISTLPLLFFLFFNVFRMMHNHSVKIFVCWRVVLASLGQSQSWQFFLTPALIPDKTLDSDWLQLWPGLWLHSPS